MGMIMRACRSYNHFLRYAVLGIATNLLGYMLYLAVTAWGGLGPKTAMTGLYCLGMLVGFIGNRQWAFHHKGRIPASLLRYLVAHAGGYGLNYAMLHLFAYSLHYPHQLVQAAAIVVVALYLFTAFKYFVFPQKTRASQ